MTIKTSQLSANSPPQAVATEAYVSTTIANMG